MNTDSLKDKIEQIVASKNGDLESTQQKLSSLNDIELFIWLNEQDNSLRYHLALELDVRLQHLDHTCSTLKHIQNLLGSTSLS